MAQGGKIFDDLGRLMNDAAGVADGVRREVETVIRSQMERVTADMDLVKRDEFEALRELVRNQTDDIERLKAEIETLKSGGKSS
jgi:BMFP domain-containing protein YqiC